MSKIAEKLNSDRKIRKSNSRIAHPNSANIIAGRMEKWSMDV